MSEINYEENVKKIIKSIEDYKNSDAYKVGTVEELKKELEVQEKLLEHYDQMAEVVASTDESFAKQMLTTRDKIRELQEKVAKREEVEKKYEEKKENLTKYVDSLKEQKENIKTEFDEASKKIEKNNEKITELKAKEDKTEGEVNELNELISEREALKEYRKEKMNQLPEVNKALAIYEEYAKENGWVKESKEPEPELEKNEAPEKEETPEKEEKDSNEEVEDVTQDDSSSQTIKAGNVVSYEEQVKKNDPEREQEDKVKVKFDAKKGTYRLKEPGKNEPTYEMTMQEMMEQEDFKALQQQVEETLGDNAKIDIFMAYNLSKYDQEHGTELFKNYCDASQTKADIESQLIYDMKGITGSKYLREVREAQLEKANEQSKFGLATVSKNRWTKLVEKHKLLQRLVDAKNSVVYALSNQPLPSYEQKLIANSIKGEPEQEGTKKEENTKKKSKVVEKYSPVAQQYNEKIRNAKTQEELEQILAENKGNVWRNKADENLIKSAIVETRRKFAKEEKDISIAKEQARPQKDLVAGVEVIDVDAENDHEGH